MRKVFFLFVILVMSSLVLSQEQTNDNTKEEQKQEEQTTEQTNQEEQTIEQENLDEQKQENGDDPKNPIENVDENNDNQLQQSEEDEKNGTENLENAASEECEDQDKSNHKITFIGKLVKTKPLTLKKPSEYALEDGYLYKSTDYYIGDLNVYSEYGSDISSLEGRIVVAHGHIEQDLNKVLTFIGECPEGYGEQESMMQIRSDWVSEETGFSVGRSSVEKLQKVNFFNYNRIKEYKMFRLKEYTDTKKVEIVFQNILGKSISDITLTAHYESVFGKPVPMTQDKVFSNLAPGESASFVVPIMISSIKKYELQSVKVVANNETIIINIEEYYR